MFTISSSDFCSSIEATVVSFAARNCAVVTDYLKLSSVTLSVCVWVLFSQMSVPSDGSVGLICSWSGILLGSRQSHMVRADSTDNDRFTGQRIPFITHFAPLFEKLFCHSWCFFSSFSVVLQKEKILHRHIWFLMDVFMRFVQMVIFKWRAFRIC